ncbi:hypothetical protein [Psychroserpens mesophilus]|uniref:hypothetical protein n=1 Tax=Psychroserpens mesophilus TaxID=325473 RepID=UPI003D64F8D6
MFKAIRLFIFIVGICCMSCENNNSEYIYKTKTGEYASKTGRFIAKFPAKPSYSKVEREFGKELLELHSFRTVLGPNKIFAIEYIDYPEAYINQMTDEEVFKLSKTNYIYQTSNTFELDYEDDIEQHGLKGKYIVLKPTQNLTEKNSNGHFLIQVFKKENRVYSISYLGRNDKQTGAFMDSFRLF